MLKLVRLLFLALLCTVLVWAAVVWQWQRSQRAVDTADIVLYLAVLPLLVVGGALALRWAWRRASAAQAAGGVTAPAAGDAAAVPAAPPERQLVMRLLAHGVVMAGADDADSALGRIAESAPLSLDPALRDADGLGVFTRRCQGIEGDAATRVLQLAERCVGPVLMQLQAAQAEPEVADEEPVVAHPTLVTRAPRPAPSKPPLHVLWGVDESASDTDRAALAQGAAQAVQRWAAQAARFDWQLEIAPVRSGVALLLQAERRLVMARRDGRDERLLVVAADSMIDEAVVDRLDAEARLFTAQRAAGVMPGEAAAALLFAPPGAAPEAGIDSDAVQLHRLSAQRRDKAADAPGRVSADTLAEALRQAVEVAQCTPDQLGAAVSDTDLQRSRTSELFEALQQGAPQLGRMEACRCAGAASGAIGIAAAPLALALAAAHALRTHETTLVLSHADRFDRLAAVLAVPPSPAVRRT